MKERNQKLINLLNNFEQYVGTVFMIAMIALMLLQVFGRYVLKTSFSWTDELATIFFIWSIYLGCSCAVTKRKHLKIDMLIRSVPFGASKILRTISNVIFLGFCCYMFPAFMNILQNLAQYNAVTAITRIPKELVYSVIPIAFVLTSIRLIQDTVSIWKEEPPAQTDLQTNSQKALDKEHIDDLSV